MDKQTFEIMKNSKTPIVGGLYRHFKGGIYQVIAIATDEAQRDKSLVIYRSVADGSVWARELSVFMSKRDKVKRPNYEQEMRLEFIGMPKYDLWR